MTKLQNITTQELYDIEGQITFMVGEGEEAVEQTNYTIVLDGVTTTIESTDEDWQVVEVEEPTPEPEPEPEPTPDPVVPPHQAEQPEPTPEEIAAAEALQAEIANKQFFIQSVNRLIVAIAAKNVAIAQGKEPNELNAQYISGMLDYVQNAMTSHPDYLDLIDKDTLSSLMSLIK